VAPQSSGSAQMPPQLGPHGSYLGWRREQPDVPGVGFAQEGSKPICPFLPVRRRQMGAQIRDRRIRPPKKIGARLVEEQIGGSGGQHALIIAWAPARPETDEGNTMGCPWRAPGQARGRGTLPRVRPPRRNRRTRERSAATLDERVLVRRLMKALAPRLSEAYLEQRG
jgi:hypothetical protein